MKNDNQSNEKADRSPDRVSPDVKIISSIVVTTGAIFACALFVLIVLDVTGVMEYPKSLIGQMHSIFEIGFSGVLFVLLYINWANYFWRRDTEQKHSLILPILTTIGFFLWLFYVFWTWN